MIAIAIDGPGGAGKSTMARALAKELGYIYVDTGALYRAIGLYMRRKGIPTTDFAAVAGNLGGVEVRLAFRDGEQRVFLAEEDVSDAIRTQDISIAASNVSAVPEVRAFLFDLQRDLAKKNHVVMDGRDIGTVVLPHAGAKVFLTAAPEARARRRLLELKQRGQETELETVLRDIVQRDEQDRNRAVAPLRQAEDAVLLDTTELGLEESLKALISLVKGRLAQ